MEFSFINVDPGHEKKHFLYHDSNPPSGGGGGGAGASRDSLGGGSIAWHKSYVTGNGTL